MLWAGDYLEYAERCRQRAAIAPIPMRRDHLLSLAQLYERDADLIEQTIESIIDSRQLIGRAEQLLHI